MVPHKTARGAAALDKLKTFEGIPHPYAGETQDDGDWPTQIGNPAAGNLLIFVGNSQVASPVTLGCP
jgi:hypothetical protein